MSDAVVSALFVLALLAPPIAVVGGALVLLLPLPRTTSRQGGPAAVQVHP
jgi:hypothetical protein